MSTKNKWRKRGKLEFKRVTGRYYDGSLAEYDVLWVRTPKGHNGRGVAYCILPHDTKWYGGKVTSGLGMYLTDGREHNPVAIGRAMRRLAYDRLARGAL